jgi:hypothetical protein
MKCGEHTIDEKSRQGLKHSQEEDSERKLREHGAFLITHKIQDREREKIKVISKKSLAFSFSLLKFELWS